MTQGKPWPKSESEFLLTEFQRTSLTMHTAECKDPRCDWQPEHHLANEVIAVTALRCVRVLAERYYEAAGFRN